MIETKYSYFLIRYYHFHSFCFRKLWAAKMTRVQFETSFRVPPTLAGTVSKSLRLHHSKSSSSPRARHCHSNLKPCKLFHMQSNEPERLHASKISHIGSNPTMSQKLLLFHTRSTRRYPSNSSKASGGARIRRFYYSFSSRQRLSSSSLLSFFFCFDLGFE